MDLIGKYKPSFFLLVILSCPHVLVSVSLEDAMLNKIVDPNQAVVFLNTDKSNYVETKTHARICNEGEASLVAAVMKKLLNYGLKLSKVGVITPYRNQIKILCEKLQERHIDQEHVDIDTVDKYQV